MTVVPFVNGVDGGDTSTTNVPTGTALLFESLKGISVTGDGADLYTVKVLGLARAKEVAMRGTKGVNRDQPTVFVRFADMSNTHLENTLANGRNVSPDERRIIESVLEDRQLADLAAPVDADEFDDTDEV